MFNLDDDPHEMNDLAITEPLITAALGARYRQLAKEMYAPNGDEAEATAARMGADCDHDQCWEDGVLWARRSDASIPSDSKLSAACEKMLSTGYWQPYADSVPSELVV